MKLPRRARAYSCGFNLFQGGGFVCSDLSRAGAFYQQLWVFWRRGYMVRLDIHWGRQFFLDGASHFALRATPADFVANFKILGSQEFPLDV